MIDTTASRDSAPPKSSARDAVTCQVLESFEDLAPLAREWDAVVQATGSTVYMTFDWIRVWWKFYGRRSSLRLFLFHRGSDLVAVLPIYIQRLGFGPFQLRIARLVGANIPPKVFDPPVPVDSAPRVFELLLEKLFGDRLCDFLSFGPFSDLHRSAFELTEASRRFTRHGLLASCDADDVHTIFRLPRDMEEYFASLSKNERKNRRKYELRSLEKEHSVREDCVTEPADVGVEFDAFAVQHARQWAEQGKPGHFGSWPLALEYNRALVDAQARRGRVRFLRIHAGDQVVSRQYAFALGQSLAWELPSREIGDAWERFSLGPTGIVRMLAYGIDEGLSRVEGGLAHYDYKLRLGATEHPVHTIRVSADLPGTRMRVALWSALRRVVRLVYHKVWYRRIQPHLPPVFRRPQPFFWLRLDF
ncbi:MAG: GNAT family N-acetyltransferase [Limisphaerales bacterium]